MAVAQKSLWERDPNQRTQTEEVLTPKMAKELDIEHE
jgi:hypothetical protein